MISYTKKNIVMLSLIASVILLCFINYAILYFYQETIKIEKHIPMQAFNPSNATEVRGQVTLKEEQYQEETQEKWEIEIPKINLIAPIAQGIEEQTMNQYVGHFTNTPLLEGNVALGAHNRGYPVNYFAYIKNLQMGDLIIYHIGNATKMYEVDVITIIQDTNWEYLKNTEENKITLITCVENQPEYRRCIQASEREEN